jgi:hypothetical protein
MRVRDSRLLPVLPALVVALALAYGAGVAGADALIAVPALLLVLPLVAGRYVGEERLVRLARRPPALRRRGDVRVVRPRTARRVGPRGGVLIAVALARRGPPQGAVAR